MKHHTKIIGFLLVLLTFSCKDGEQQSQSIATESQEITEQPILTANLKETHFEIGGMACEFGCAKMIENKLSNTRGVDSVKVNFETNLAYISFDKTLQSKEQLKNAIENLADGNTYKVFEIINEQ